MTLSVYHPQAIVQEGQFQFLTGSTLRVLSNWGEGAAFALISANVPMSLLLYLSRCVLSHTLAIYTKLRNPLDASCLLVTRFSFPLSSHRRIAQQSSCYDSSLRFPVSQTNNSVSMFCLLMSMRWATFDRRNHTVPSESALLLYTSIAFNTRFGDMLFKKVPLFPYSTKMWNCYQKLEAGCLQHTDKREKGDD